MWQTSRPVITITVLWVLSMIALPILLWTMGESVLRYGIVAGVVFQVLVVVVTLQQAWGWRRTLTTIAGIVVIAWLAEWLGSTTGIPFGGYDYTKVLQPQALGVPLLIPFAWLMMLPPSWAVAGAILGFPSNLNNLKIRLAFILLSAVFFTLWDFYLDPQMVDWGFWIWEKPSGYFGIPWSNFLGWLVISALITAIFGRIDLPYLPLILVYGITWMLQGIGQFLFWGLPGPAIFGFLSMGIVFLLALRQLRNQYKPAPSP